jgi:hypothetical protein
LEKEDLIDSLHRRDKNYLMEKCPEKIHQKNNLIQTFRKIEVIIKIKVNFQIEDLAVNLEILRSRFQMIAERTMVSNLNLELLENLEETENDF